MSYHCTCTCIYVCWLCVVHQYQLSLFYWPYPVGSRLSHLHLLSGGLLPLLSLLETTMVRYAHTSEHSKEAHSLRVVRVKLDNGKRVIGVRYPLPLISEVASMLRMVKNSALVSICMYMCVFVCMCMYNVFVHTSLLLFIQHTSSSAHIVGWCWPETTHSYSYCCKRPCYWNWDTY